MSTGNPARNVGGTAQDGGVSTADTVRDGGPDATADDSAFVPSGGETSRAGNSQPAKNLRTAGERAGGSSSSGTTSADAPSRNTRAARDSAMEGGGSAKTSNAAYGVGGTAQDGGVSTADTVADGGPDGDEPDGTYGA